MSAPETTNVIIRTEATPNPASVRFVLNCPVLEHGTAEIRDAESARARSPLASRLFGLAAVKGVFLGANFVTVSAEPGVEWSNLAGSVIGIIREHLAAEEPVLVGEPDAAAAGSHPEDEVTKGVIQIIDQEIRPAVAMDGGDIVFENYQDGIVYLKLRGSCHGCPSSMMTLKMGIERRLQEEFPEIVAVEAI